MSRIGTALTIIVNTSVFAEKGAALLPEATTDETVEYKIESETILPKEIEVESEQDKTKNSGKE